MTLDIQELLKHPAMPKSLFVKNLARNPLSRAIRKLRPGNSLGFLLDSGARIRRNGGREVEIDTRVIVSNLEHLMDGVQHHYIEARHPEQGVVGLDYFQYLTKIVAGDIPAEILPPPVKPVEPAEPVAPVSPVAPQDPPSPAPVEPVIVAPEKPSEVELPRGNSDPTPPSETKKAEEPRVVKHEKNTPVFSAEELKKLNREALEAIAKQHFPQLGDLSSFVTKASLIEAMLKSKKG